MAVPGRKIDISAGVPCDLCLLLGKNEKAEHFCADCNEFFCDKCCMVHKVTRYSRNHKLLDSGNMPKQKLESSEDSVCSKHSGEGLKYFCEDHNTTFCSVCVILDHKNCNLLFIDEIATDFDKTPEYKSLTDSIVSLTKQLQEMKEMSIKKGEDLKKSHGKFITDVKAFREEINQILDTIEDTIIKESDALKEDHLKLAVSASAICDNILAELNMASEKMREQLRYMQHRQLVMSAKDTQIKVKEYQSKLVEMSQGKSMELEFVPNEKLLQSLRSYTNMGDIKQSDVPFEIDDTVNQQKDLNPGSSTMATPLKEHASCKTPENDIIDVPFKIDTTITLPKKCNPGFSTLATPLKKHAAYKTPKNRIVLYLKVRAIIETPLTSETLKACVKKMKSLSIDTRDELEGVVNLIYEKAISKDANCVVFANLCRFLSMVEVKDQVDSKKTYNFRVILLERLQRDFEKICLTCESKRPAIQDRKTKEKKMQHEMEAEKREIPAAWKEIIEFLGEVFNLKMLGENIVHDCVFQLLRNKESFHLECACILLKSVGKVIDDTATGKTRMDQYFDDIKKHLADRTVSPSTKTKMELLLILRSNCWNPNRLTTTGDRSRHSRDLEDTDT